MSRKHHVRQYAYSEKKIVGEAQPIEITIHGDVSRNEDVVLHLDHYAASDLVNTLIAAMVQQRDSIQNCIDSALNQPLAERAQR